MLPYSIFLNMTVMLFILLHINQNILFKLFLRVVYFFINIIIDVDVRIKEYNGDYNLSI